MDFLTPELIRSASKGIELKSDSVNPIKKQSKAWRFLPPIGQGADLATTLFALNGGLEENNPLLGNKPAIVGAKAGMGILGYYLTKKLEKEHPKASKAVSMISGLGGLVPAALNLRTISKSNK